MLHELDITNEGLDNIIKPHTDFLDHIEEKELVEWSDLLMRQHPHLSRFNESVRKLIGYENKANCQIYSVTAARTFLTCRFLLELSGKKVEIGDDEIQEYKSSMLNEIQKDLAQKASKSPDDFKDEALNIFLSKAPCPRQFITSLVNFFTTDKNLIDLMMPDTTYYPDEMLNHIYRGAGDIIFPLTNTLRKKVPDQIMELQFL